MCAVVFIRLLCQHSLELTQLFTKRDFTLQPSPPDLICQTKRIMLTAVWDKFEYTTCCMLISEHNTQEWLTGPCLNGSQDLAVILDSLFDIHNSMWEYSYPLNVSTLSHERTANFIALHCVQDKEVHRFVVGGKLNKVFLFLCYKNIYIYFLFFNFFINSDTPE